MTRLYIAGNGKVLAAGTNRRKVARLALRAWNEQLGEGGEPAREEDLTVTTMALSPAAEPTKDAICRLVDIQDLAERRAAFRRLPSGVQSAIRDESLPEWLGDWLDAEEVCW